MDVLNLSSADREKEKEKKESKKVEKRKAKEKDRTKLTPPLEKKKEINPPPALYHDLSKNFRLRTFIVVKLFEN